MLSAVVISCVLVIITVVMHAFGFSLLLRAMVQTSALTASSILPITRVMIGLTFWLIVIHFAEICVWGLFYYWWGCLPDAESAFYFSGVTYTTLGYGDVVLPKPWRVLAPVEALTSILMCGLSTGLFFAFANRWIGSWMKQRLASESQPGTPGSR